MEFWDIYDGEKKLTGRVMRRNDFRLQEGEYHLTVLGVVRTPEEKFLITRRALDKAWAPGWWEVPGGAVLAGESSRAAVARELLEETGLDVAKMDAEEMLSYKRENLAAGDNYFVDCYRFVLNFAESEVKIREREVLEWKLATAEEIRELAAQGIFLHYDSIKDVFSCKKNSRVVK